MKVYNCTCGKMATWSYMPSTVPVEYHFFCEDCVGRGCSCNEYSDCEDMPLADEIEYLNKYGSKWRWKEEGKIIERIDDKGRLLPCCEYWFDPDGHESSEEENEFFRKHGVEFSEREVDDLLIKYKKMEGKLNFIRQSNLGLESEEEDNLLDEMDMLWRKLSTSEMEQLNSYPDTSLIRNSTTPETAPDSKPDISPN